jgi:glucans biosynthesis protein
MAGAGFAPGGALGATGRWGPAQPFGWTDLVDKAQRAARRPYAPRPLSKTAAPDFDSHVRLAYGPAERLAGAIRLFPTRQGIAPQAVGIHVVDNGLARALVDTRGLFGGADPAEPAGFRVMDANGGSDWMAFLGASYFRAAGERNQYGLSARGVAIDMGLPEGEEFPAFTDFWIEAKTADRVIIHALLDGPSLCGAYAMDTRRTATSIVQDVNASLFLRRDVRRLGLAPISSMFCFDESNTGDRRDWRPEVHDSDGLAILSGDGERIWRPLDNPPSPRLHTFRADHARGFGLLQRDQTFAHYEDDGTFYDRRPSLWVEPRGDWGPGAIILYETNAASETVDNIGVFWASDWPARAGQRRDVAYSLTWTSHDPSADANARCVNVFVGPGGVPGASPIVGATRYVIDFAGPALDGLGRGSGVEAVTNVPVEALLRRDIGPLANGDGRWRVTLDVRTQDLAQSDFRLFLKRGAATISETVIKTIRP